MLASGFVDYFVFADAYGASSLLWTARLLLSTYMCLHACVCACCARESGRDSSTCLQVQDTMYIDFKFEWKSSNAVDHLHLFASTGTAAFMGDNLPLDQALAHLAEGEGKIEVEAI